MEVGGARLTVRTAPVQSSLSVCMHVCYRPRFGEAKGGKSGGARRLRDTAYLQSST